MQLIKKTIYLREEDLELWAACPNKSLLVHNALRETPIMQRAYHKSDQNDKFLMEELAGFRPAKTGTLGNLCKIHATPLDNRGKCLQKGCKNG